MENKRRTVSETNESFISEPVKPDKESFSMQGMASGEPGLPRLFQWRGKDYEVADVLETWKTTGPCRSGSAERYVRRHWHRIRAGSGEIMTLYCERNPEKRRGKPKDPWILFSMSSADNMKKGNTKQD